MSNDVLLIFLEELRELKEQLDTALLTLRKNYADQSSIDAAFRALHTVKGSGAMCGLTQLSEFAHAFETLFDEFRKGNAAVSQEVIRLSFEASDLLPELTTPSDVTAARSAAILSGLAAVVDGAPASSPAPRGSSEIRLSPQGQGAGTGCKPRGTARGPARTRGNRYHGRHLQGADP